MPTTTWTKRAGRANGGGMTPSRAASPRYLLAFAAIVVLAAVLRV
jgi:hypothetical protein